MSNTKNISYYYYYYYYYTVDNALVVIHWEEILSAGGHESVTVKRTTVQFSLEEVTELCMYIKLKEYEV